MNRNHFWGILPNFRRWKLLGLTLLVGLLAACKPSEAPVATIVVVDKKMPLVEWPDSLYIADLDSILALEPLKKQDKNKPSIAMNTFKAPNFILPSSVTGEKTAKQSCLAANQVGHRKFRWSANRHGRDMQAPCQGRRGATVRLRHRVARMDRD